MFFPVPPRRDPPPTEAAPHPADPPPPSRGDGEPASVADAPPPWPSPLGSEELAGKIYAFAAEQMTRGVGREEIEASLGRCGLTPAEAKEVVTTLSAERTRVLRAAASRNMKVGALWCGGGLLVTIASFQSGGGSFVIAWGAILYGAIQFFRGMSQSDE